MRTIIGNIKNLVTNYANREIKFIFSDRYGNETKYHDKNMMIKSKATTSDIDGNFTIELFETLALKNRFNYQIEITTDEVDGLAKTKIHIPLGNAEININELYEFEKELDNFYEYIEVNGTFEFSYKIEEIFEKYFAGENEFFNKEEENLIKEYENFANKINNREDMKALNKYLGSL